MINVVFGAMYFTSVIMVFYAVIRSTFSGSFPSAFRLNISRHEIILGAIGNMILWGTVFASSMFLHSPERKAGALILFAIGLALILRLLAMKAEELSLKNLYFSLDIINKNIYMHGLPAKRGKHIGKLKIIILEEVNRIRIRHQYGTQRKSSSPVNPQNEISVKFDINADKIDVVKDNEMRIMIQYEGNTGKLYAVPRIENAGPETRQETRHTCAGDREANCRANCRHSTF